MMRLTLARVLYVLMNIIISQVTINIKGICSKLFKQTGTAPSYLHEHFQTVQGSCAGSGHGTCTSTCNQMSPPHPCLPLFHSELIRDSQIFSYIKDLQK